MKTTIKQNWFETLVDALESENLLDLWDPMSPHCSPISYGETRRFRADDGSRYGHFISIFRHDSTGRYERPVHYKC